MKRTLPFILCALSVLLGKILPAQAADPHYVDSLNTLLSGNLPDSVRASVNMKVADYYLNSLMGEDAKSYLETAATLFTKLHLPKKAGEAKDMLGNAYYYHDEYEQAILHWKEAMAIATTINDKELFMRAKGNMANGLTAQGKYPEALSIWYEVLAYAENKGDSMAVGMYLGNAAVIYAQIGEYAKGIALLERAIPIMRAEKNYFATLNSQQNLGNLYESNGEYEKSFTAFSEAKAIAEEQQLFEWLPYIYMGMGLASQKMHRYDEAYDYLQKSYESYVKVGEENSLDAAITFENMGALYYEMAVDTNTAWLSKYFNGDRNKALSESRRLIENAIGIFQEYSDLENLKTAYKNLSDTEKELGHFDKALEYIGQHHALSDSLFNMERDKKIAQKEMQYNFDKKEAYASAEQEKKDIRERNVRNFVLAGLVAALVFGVVVFIQRNRISKEKRRSEELLLNILPAEVAEELKEKGEAEAKLIEEATVLFTDFKGFTALSEKLTPKELVRDLHECFTAFDNIMQKHGLEKIKTIGDAYMAAGGLPTPNKVHASGVVNAALEIRDFMEAGKTKRMAKGQVYFEIRIGVHTGPVVAGIVGVKKFSYDIWGDTVNTASRMESSGQIGKVNISETTYELVKDQFDCSYRGKIPAKNKGEMNMYFVERS